ncbi:MAG: hypothetical protein WEF50_01595 [Myxococcota bacterium]
MTDLRERYESYREARVRARRAWLSGESAELDYEKADEEHLDVTSGDALPALLAAAAAASFADGRERHARLVAAVQASVVARATRELAARTRARPDVPALHEERVARESEALAGLGFANARGFAESLRPAVDYGAWSAHADAFLAASRAAHRDARAALRPLAWHEVLPASRLRPALDFALAGLHVPLERAVSLRVDDAAGSSRRESAFAVAPLVPREVWLVYAPDAGIPALEALFAAAGAALHAAFTSESLPIERRALGDPAAALIWRHFLPCLLADPSFAEAGPAAGRAEAFGAVLRARRLEASRRAAALIGCELALAELAPGADPHGLESLYAERVESALGQTPDESQFLIECSARLQAVDELRATAVAAELVRHLRERFGRRWWASRAAGELLLELMHTGTTYSPEALARELGLAPPGAESLARALV